MPQLHCPVLLARGQELDVMSAMVSAGVGGVVAVVGAAGIGKSRLVRERAAPWCGPPQLSAAWRLPVMAPVNKPAEPRRVCADATRCLGRGNDARRESGGAYSRRVLHAERIDRLAHDTGFSGVVRVDRDGQPGLARAYGWAHRGAGIPNTTGTRLAVASGVKGFTALTVTSLVEEGRLALDTPARDVLGADLPLIDSAVTVGHLLAHRSGIGDYLDEDAGHSVTDYVLPVPVHRLDSTEAYLLVLDGHEQRSTPGERFASNNGGYVLLALIAERVTGCPFSELVDERVCRPAGMTDTAFLRSDEPTAGVALGYLGEGLRTNVLHLPVLGSGDGGAVTTAGDLATFWTALFEGRIVPLARVAEMVRPRSRTPDGRRGYGLGFWLVPGSAAVALEGYDAGVSFRSVCDPERRLTWSVLANTTEGARPVVRLLCDLLGG